MESEITQSSGTAGAVVHALFSVTCLEASIEGIYRRSSGRPGQFVAWFPFEIRDSLQALPYRTGISAGVAGFDLNPVLKLCLSVVAGISQKHPDRYCFVFLYCR
jgi:hypothetical protein